MRTIFLLLLLTGMMTSCFDGERPINTGPVERMKNLVLRSSSGNHPLKDYEQFSFNANSNQPNLSDNNIKFLADLEKYMKVNPDISIRITGFFLENEKNKGAYVNLGVSRAAKIRDMLAKKGVAANRFDLRGESPMKGSSLIAPISFKVISKEKGQSQPLPVVQTFEERTYYFNTDSGGFQPTEQFKLYATKLKAYLDKNKEKRIELIGHTDSDGSSESNYSLGKKRAETMKKHFVTQGISSARIIVKSLGEIAPAVSNDSQDGKAKNNRVVVKIK